MKDSLREKVFRMNILLIAVALMLFTVLGIYQVRRYISLMEKTNRSQNEVIMDTMSDTMKDIAATSFQKYVAYGAELFNGEFWAMRHDLQVLATQVQKVLEEPPGYAAAETALSLQDDADGMRMRVLYSETADRDDPEMKEQIRRIGGLGSMMTEMVKGSDSMYYCMVSLPDGASVITYRIPEGDDSLDGETLSYSADTRPWYVGAVVNEKAYFSPLNKDYFFDAKEVMAGVPVYVDGELAAVCGGSIYLDSLEYMFTKAEIIDNAVTCLLNENGSVIFSSRQEGELGMASGEFKSLLESNNEDLVLFVDKALDGNSDFALLDVDGKPTYVACAPVTTLGWTLLLSISQEDLNAAAYLLAEQTDAVMEESVAEMQDNEGRIVVRTLFIAALMLLVAGLLSLVFSKRLVDPIKRMTLRVSEMQGKDMNFELEDMLLTGDEIEVLARAFAGMSEKMKGYVREIVDITAEKQRMDTELSVAAGIQLSMLPAQFPVFSDRKEFDLYAVMDPAKEVGGDFYDFFLIDDDHLAMVIADVSGKGVPASLFMVISKTLIKNVSRSGQYSSPSEILTDVNRRLYEENKGNMFVTVWLGILTISTGKLVTANAGHEYPVFYRKDRGFVLEHDPHGLFMGVRKGMKYTDAEWHLAPGDMLFVYTDGVTEAHNSSKELFGETRMLTALERSRQEADETGDPERTDLQLLLKTMRAQIDDYAGNAPQFDDITMMCLDYHGSLSESTGKCYNQIQETAIEKITDEKGMNGNELNVEAALERLPEVQDFVERQLEAAGCPMDLMMKIIVAVEEIYTNIARYSYGPEGGRAVILVEADKDPRAVTFTFTDWGVPYDPLAKKDPDISLPAKKRKIGGLGIFMTKQIMDDISYEYKDGKNILKLKKNLQGGN